MDEEDFLANVVQEGSDPFAELDKQEDVPAESQSEKTKEETSTTQSEEQSAVEEKQVPYHKDPRWVKQRQDLESERKARLDAESRIQRLEQEFQEARGGKVTQPEFLTDLVGENEVVAQNFQKYEQGLRQSIIEELKNQQNLEQQRQKEAQEKSLNWVNQNLDELSAETGIALRLSTGELTQKGKDLLELIAEYPVDDGMGNIDIRKGYEMLQKLSAQETLVQAQKSQVRKDIADKTISKDNSGKVQKDYMTSNDFRGKGWHSLLN